MKSIFKYKTLWVNVALAAGAAFVNQVTPLIPPDVYAAGVAVVNILLRRVTSEPVSILGGR